MVILFIHFLLNFLPEGLTYLQEKDNKETSAVFNNLIFILQVKYLISYSITKPNGYLDERYLTVKYLLIYLIFMKYLIDNSNKWHIYIYNFF